MSSEAQSLSLAEKAPPPLRSEPDAESLALAFFSRLDACDVTGASALVAADADVDFSPADVSGSFAQTGARFLREWTGAFPDLRLRVRSSMGDSDIAVLETTMQGTQSADFLGITNQGKRIEIDQAWVITTFRGKIASIRAYWCQSQLYRRLGVRRLDQIGG